MPEFRGPAQVKKAAYRYSQLQTASLQRAAAKEGNPKKRAQKFAMAQIQAYSTNITVTLKEQVATFKNVLRRLSPFERNLAQLTFLSQDNQRKGHSSLQKVLDGMDGLRRSVAESSKQAMALAKNAPTAKDADRLRTEGIESVEKAYDAQSDAMLYFLMTARKLGRLPSVQADEPIVVLVGMPNVGKSSIISATSTQAPEINDYPFTTRALMVGHVESDEARFQVMDTPGVLLRADDERNAMEGLTLTSVKHLPSRIVFVMDLSGTCGAQSSPKLQLRVREQLKEQFADRPWLDVRSKGDLPLAEEIDEADVPAGTVTVSCHAYVCDMGGNIDRLRERMEQLVETEMEIEGS